MSKFSRTDPRRRILFVSNTTEWKGPTASLTLLLKYLRRKYDVAVLAPGKGPFSDTLQTLRIPVYSHKNLKKRSIPWIFRLIRRESFDIIYGNSTAGSSHNALVAAKLAGKPFIYHVRSILTKWPRTLSIYLHFADAIIPVSHAAAEPLVQRGLSKQLHVVHNGTEVETNPEISGIFRTSNMQYVKLLDGRPTLINVGRINRGKGQEYAVLLVSRAKQLGVDLNLLLVGEFQDTEYATRLRRLIGQLGLEDRIALTGFSNDVRSLLRAADIYVHTSLQEAFPRAVIEAMAARLPVIAFAVDGVNEAVVNGQTGYLVPKGDLTALVNLTLRLARDHLARSRMGTAAMDRIKNSFTAEQTAEKVATIIDGTLATRNSASQPLSI